MRNKIFPLLSLLALSLLAAQSEGGEIGYASGQSCAVSANVVTCTPTAGRGSLVIEAENAAFAKLRDALTPSWTGTGTFTCSECQASSGYAVCVAAGAGGVVDEADTTRKELALSRLACVLRSLIVEVDRKQARDAATWDDNPDLGGGNPG